MRTRPAKIGIAIAIAVALVIVVEIFTEGCKNYPCSHDGSRLDIRLTGAESPEDIENVIKTNLAGLYSPGEIADSYKMYYVTNGPARWVFVQVANAPRGLYMFNLYCYQQEKPDNWLLRAYVPVNGYYYTNGLGRDVTIKVDGNYVNVVFRGAVIFTGASTQ